MIYCCNCDVELTEEELINNYLFTMLVCPICYEYDQLKEE